MRDATGVSGSDDRQWAEKYKKVLAGTVPAGVLPIRPQDSEHLNGTYSFCATLGLKKVKVLKSIGHGCYQTLANLLGVSGSKFSSPEARRRAGNDALKRAFKALLENGRLPEITARGRLDSATIKRRKECPYFLRKYAQESEPTPLQCPFANLESNGSDDGSGVFEECRKDPLHQEVFDRLNTGEKS